MSIKSYIDSPCLRLLDILLRHLSRGIWCCIKDGYHRARAECWIFASQTTLLVTVR